MICKKCKKEFKVLDIDGLCFTCGFLHPLLIEEFIDKSKVKEETK